MSVQSLSYVALEVSKIDDWRALLERVFGLQLVDNDHVTIDNATLHFRTDRRHHRITLHRGSSETVSTLGWEVGSQEELEQLAGDLRQRGITLTKADETLCAARRMTSVYSFYEPNIGVPSEIAFGPTDQDCTFTPSRDIAPLNVGAELGLGHIVFWTADLQATVDFYVEVMGFKVSDTMAWDDNDGVFLHCNKRHHTLAVMAEAEGRPAGKLGHLMLESTKQDDVGSGYDIARDMGVPIALEPGKHTNDLMQSFYLETPSGFWMEYGFGGRLIEGEWVAEHYDAPMLWGHRMAAR